MNKPNIFLSTPKAFNKKQEQFICKVEEYLTINGLNPVTLGRNQYNIDSPLIAIRDLMNDCDGLICLGLRKTFIVDGIDRPDSDLGEKSTTIDRQWSTSAYCQIEPAMAYQIGLPICVWKEKDVIGDGMFDRGTAGLSIAEFDVEIDIKLSDPSWSQPLQQWINKVKYHWKDRTNDKGR